MGNIAFIFARGQSKRLPGKNIKLLAGKPLIAWSIETAKEVESISRVIVSTDSNEISDIALKYGAEVPFIRPAELAKDETPEWLAWKHALSYLKDTTKEFPEFMISVPATSPLRNKVDIENCIKEYKKGNVEAVITVTNSHRNPYFNVVKEDLDGTISIVNKMSTSINNRQSAPEVFDMTTVCYVVNSKFIMTHNAIFDGRVRAVHIPAERSIDIDTLLDFDIAEALLLKKKVEN